MQLNRRYFLEGATINCKRLPGGYRRLPKHCIGHCHMKDVMRGA